MKLPRVPDYDLMDFHIHIGVMLAAIGVAFIYWPAGLIVVGVAAFFLGVWRQ